MIGPGISPTLGIRGVLAYADIAAGTVVEIPPHLEIPEAEVETISKTLFDRYLFKTDFGVLLLLGFGSLYNHSSKPTAIVITRGKRIMIETLVDLEAGDEVTISYSNDPVVLKKHGMD